MHIDGFSKNLKESVNQSVTTVSRGRAAENLFNFLLKMENGHSSYSGHIETERPNVTTQCPVLSHYPSHDYSGDMFECLLQVHKTHVR